MPAWIGSKANRVRKIDNLFSFSQIVVVVWKIEGGKNKFPDKFDNLFAIEIGSEKLFKFLSKPDKFRCQHFIFSCVVDEANMKRFSDFSTVFLRIFTTLWWFFKIPLTDYVLWLLTMKIFKCTWVWEPFFLMRKCADLENLIISHYNNRMNVMQ